MRGIDLQELQSTLKFYDKGFERVVIFKGFLWKHIKRKNSELHGKCLIQML